MKTGDGRVMGDTPAAQRAPAGRDFAPAPLFHIIAATIQLCGGAARATPGLSGAGLRRASYAAPRRRPPARPQAAPARQATTLRPTPGLFPGPSPHAGRSYQLPSVAAP